MREHHINKGKIMKDTSKYLQDSYACEFCGKVFKTGRQLGGHTAHCPKHPDKQAHDLATKKGRELLKVHLQDGTVVHPFKGKHLSKEHKEKLSAARAKNLVNEYLPREWVHIRWHKVKNLKGEEFSVRGSWEVNVAKRLNDLGIYWIKASPIKYESDIVRHYTPDFYLPKENVFIEVKGRYTDEDRLKMRLVKEQHPELKIYFLLQQKYIDFIDGKISLSDNLLFEI